MGWDWIGRLPGGGSTLPTALRHLVLLLLALVLLPYADGGVHLVLPASGAVSGASTVVTVMGSNFFHTSKTSCKFGAAVVPGNVTGDSTFTCTPPPASLAGAGFVYVEVSMNAEDFTTSGVTFLYREPPQLAAVHPVGVESGGGAIVTVTSRPAGLGGGGGGGGTNVGGGGGRGGGGFTPDTECVFLGSGGGGMDDLVSGGALMPVDAAGGGGGNAGGRFVSSALMSCETPRLSPGAHEITVGQPPGGFSIAAVGARAFASWSVPRDIALAGESAGAGAGAVPGAEAVARGTARGDVGGGTSVSVAWASSSSSAGVDFFGRGSISCRFGTVEVHAPVDYSRSEGGGGATNNAMAACVSPAGVAGRRVPLWIASSASTRAPMHTLTHLYDPRSVVDGRVTEGLAAAGDLGGGGDGSVTSGDITAVIPRHVSHFGSSRTVAMVGKDFLSGVSRCVVGGSSLAAEFVSSSLMLCELPSHAPGAVAVSSTGESPTESVASVLYRMEAAVEGLSASSGATSGGTATVVSGDQMPDGDGLSCRVGSVGPLGARWLSRNSVECVTPAHVAADVRVSLELFGHSHSSTSLGFEYVEAGTVSGVMPALGPVTGMVPLEIIGWGLPRNLPCRVGGTEAPGCVLPAGGMGFTDVAVDSADTAWGTHAVVSYQARPQVSGLLPKTGYARGGSVAIVQGVGFIEESATCVFGGVKVGAVFISSGMLLCETPAISVGTATVETSGGGGTIHSGSELTMTVIADMVVTQVSPASGPLEGGNVLTVHGEHFVGIEPVGCKIGSVGPLTARDQGALGLNGTSSLECIAPGREASIVSVEVGIRTAGYTNNEKQYTYESALAVQAVIPSGGQSSTSRSINVYGISIRMGEGTTCVIGSRATQGSVPRAGEMVCSNVPGGGEGFVAVGSGGLRVVNGELDVLYEFRKPAEAVGVYPRSGYAGGGSLVHVVGRHMASAGCSLGGIPGSAHVVSSALMKCEAPASAVEGDVGMQLLDGWQAGSAAELMYEYRAEEAVLDVTPTNSTSSGGSLVEVQATGLLSNARGLACAVGTIAPVSARWVQERLVECHMPSHSTGVVEVRIGAGGEYGVIGKEMVVTTKGVLDAYVEHNASSSEVTAMEVYYTIPMSGPVDGGSRVMVSGAELGRSVDFGGMAVDAEVVSSVLAIVESPGGTIGPVAVQDLATFSYTLMGVVSHLSPPSVTTDGGALVTVSGSFGVGFSEMACRVGTIGPISGRWISSDKFECFAPYRIAGKADFAVAVGYGDTNPTNVSLEYVLSNVTDLSFADDIQTNATAGEAQIVIPRHVSILSSSRVTMVGKDFLSGVSRCVVGGSSLAAEFVSSSLMLCELPSHAPGAVAVSSTGESPTESVASVLYRMEAAVEGLSASSGATSGGTATVVSGDQMPDGDGLSCRVGSVGPLGARWLSRNSVECVTPAHVAADVRVSLELFGHSHSSTSLGFEYVEAGTVSGVMPALGPVTGMVPLEIIGWGLPRNLPCRVGGTEAPGCVLPAGGMGFTDVAVDSADTAWGTHAVVSYQARPQVSGLLPKTGYARGGSVAIVQGVGFIEESATCVFGGVKVGAVFISSGMLLCETPAGDIGTVPVESIQSTSDMTMMYVADMAVSRITPRSGPLEGGNVITMSGDNFIGSGAVGCKIGSVGPLTARDQSTSSLECIAPAHEGRSEIVEVGIHSTGYTHDELKYTYESALAVQAVIPSGGQSSTSRSINVYGISIRMGEGTTCVIGSRATQGSVPRAGEMVCSNVPGGSEGFVAVGSGGLRVVNGELDVLYEFRKPAEAVGVYPRSGYAGGGSLVHVVGRHMASAGCSLGGIPGSAHVVSSALMKCEAPASAVEGDVGMQLLDGWQAGSAAELMYEYRAEEAVLDVTPTNSTSSGGSLVEVQATGLLSNARGLACAVGTIAPVSARWVQERLVECRVPSHSTGVVEVRIGAGGEYGVIGKEMVVTTEALGAVEEASSSEVTAMEVFSMIPMSGPVDGGSRVMVSGAELGRSVDFGGMAVDMEVVSSVLAIVESPGGTVGDVTVHDKLTFAYTEAVTVQSIQPTTVTTVDAGTFTLSGFFGAGHAKVACRVGTIGPISGRFIDSHTVECVAPRHVAGVMDVALAVGYGDTNPTNVSLEYVLSNVTDLSFADDIQTNATAGDITAVIPRHVSHFGSSRTVAMVGKDFLSGVSRCVVGGSSLAAEFVSSSLMLCELPSHAPGAVAVSSTGESPTESVASVLYRMEAAVEGLSASSGATSGGTATVVSGDQMPDGDGLSCRVGSVGPLGARWLSRNSVECVTPAHVAADVRVSLELFGHSHSSTSLGFEYVEAGTVSGVMPALGPVTGMVPLEIIGWGLPRNLPCRVGGTEAPGCVLPAGGMGFTDVAVDSADTAWGTHAVVSYQARPQVSGLLPKTGYARGGSIAIVQGVGFIEESATCVFGGVKVGAVFISSGMLLCETPAISVGTATVETSGGGGTIHSGSELTMTVIADMVVTQVSPASGPLEGGNVLTVHGEHFVGIEPVGCKIGSVGPLTARDQGALGLNGTSSLECIAPGREASIVSVEVGIRTAGYTNNERQYAYSQAVAVQAVIPSGGQSSTSRSINVYGISIRMGEGTTCVIGSRATQGSVPRAGEMVCSNVPGGGEGFVAVGSGGLRVVNGELDVLYEFRKPAEAVGVYPRSGYAGGGSLVHVVGRHMASAGCSLGGIPGSAHVVSSALMKCEAPASAVEGDVGMQLLDGWQAGSAAELMYEYRAEEAVLDVTPTNSTSSGGSLVEVQATGLLSNARGLACAVGTIAPVSARWVQERLVECRVPSHSTGVVEVRIGAGGEYGVIGKEMVVTTEALGAVEEASSSEVTAMEVFLMIPMSGPVDGGSRVMVSGAELGRSVDFGGMAVDMEVVSSVLAIVESPGGTIGPVSVHEAEGATFAYTEAVTVQSIQPTTVTSDGGALVTVTGSLGVGHAKVACRVGTIGPLTGIYVASVEFHCLTPAKRPGAADFFAGVRDNVGWTSSPTPVTYEQPPSASAVMPPAVLVGHPAAIDVFGLWLSSAACSRDDGGAAAALAAAGSEMAGAVSAGAGIRCSSAAFPGAAAFVAVRVMDAAHGGSAVVPMPLVRVAAPRLSGVLPRGGGGDGGAVIHLVGAGLASEAASAASSPLRCVFGSGVAGSAAAHAYAVSSALARCETPPLVGGGAVNLGPGGGDVPLTLAVGSAAVGATAATEGTTVTWAAAPTPWIRSSSPPAGGSAGGTIMSLAAGGAVEGVQQRSRSVGGRARGFAGKGAGVGGVNGGSRSGGGGAVACSLGTIGPVSTRAAPSATDGASGDLECPTPAHAHSRHVSVRIFAHASTHAPASTRALPPVASAVPDLGPTVFNGARFWYALEGHAADMDSAAAGVGPGGAGGGGLLGVGGGSNALVHLLGWGLLPPRGVSPACVVGGEVRPAVSSGHGWGSTKTADSHVACLVPPGPGGFAAVSVSGAEASAGLIVARDPAPVALGVSPGAVEAAAGGTVHVLGANLHVVAGAGFGYGLGAVGSPLAAAAGATTAAFTSVVFVSSALISAEAPVGHAPTLAASPSGVTAIAVTLVPAGATAAPDASSVGAAATSLALAVVPSRLVLGTSPRRGPCSGGTPVTLAVLPPLSNGGENGGAATLTLSCWLGTSGPVAARHASDGRVECVAPAHAPAPTPAYAAAHPGHGGLGGYLPRGVHEGAPFSSRALRGGPPGGDGGGNSGGGGAFFSFHGAARVSPLVVRATAAAAHGGDAELWLPRAATGYHRSVAGYATDVDAAPRVVIGSEPTTLRLYGLTHGDGDAKGRSGTASLLLPGRPAAGFVTLSLAGSDGAGGMGRSGGGIGVGGDGGSGGGGAASESGAAPFAQVEIVAAPVASSLAPAMTPSAGGGVLWLFGANLRGGGGGGSYDGGDLGVAAAVASAASGAVSAAAAVMGANLRVVSSAVASFEAPPMPVGPASLSLALGGGGGGGGGRNGNTGSGVSGGGGSGGGSSGGGGGGESLNAAAAAGHATLALGFLPGADVMTVSPRVGPSTAGAAGGTPMLAVSGRGFRDTGFAACRLGTVGPLSASVGASGELSCSAPALAPRAYSLEVSFNRRDFTSGSGMPEFGFDYQVQLAGHPGDGQRQRGGMYGLDLFYGANPWSGSHPPDASSFEAEASRALVRGVGPPHVPRHGDDASFFYGLRAAAGRGEGGVRVAFHEFYGLLDEEWGMLGGGGLGGSSPGAAGPHGAWQVASSDHAGGEARRQARAVHILGKDRTVVYTVASPPVALVGVVPSAVPAPAAGGASVTILGAGFPHGAVPPCGGGGGGGGYVGGAEAAAAGSGAVLSIVSRWGFASCAPGALAGTGAVVAPGFVAVAAAASAAAEPAFARASVAEHLTVLIFAAPRVDAIDPPVGPASGGTLVVVTGRNLKRGLSNGGDGGDGGDGGGGSAASATDADTWAAFGSVAVTLRAVSSAVAFAEAPAMPRLSQTGEAAPVLVIAGGASSAGAAAAIAAAGAATPTFAARHVMEVHTVTPQRGPMFGGSLITAGGSGFGGAAPLWCRAGTVGPLSARRADSDDVGDATTATKVRCLAPASRAGTFAVQVSDNRRDWSLDPPREVAVRRPRARTRPPRQIPRRRVRRVADFYGLGDFYGLSYDSFDATTAGLAVAPLVPRPPPLPQPQSQPGSFPPPSPPVAPPPDGSAAAAAASDDGVFYGLDDWSFGDIAVPGFEGFYGFNMNGTGRGRRPPPPPPFIEPPSRWEEADFEWDIPEEEFDVPIELIMPMTDFTFVPAALVAAVMPPAALAGGGGIFGGSGGSNGIAVLFATPLPRQPPPRAPSSVVTGAIGGCAYGGTSSRGAHVGRRALRGAAGGWMECAPAADPFMEGFFPVLVDGHDSGGSGGGGGSGGTFGDGGRDAPPHGAGFEYVAAPQIHAWQPELVHHGGGALVTIVGADLRRHDDGGGAGAGAASTSGSSVGALTCVFATGPRVGGSVSGYAPATSAASAVSTAVAVCEAPGGLPEGVSALSVGLAGSTGLNSATTAGTAAAPLAVTPGPLLYDVYPTAGSIAGGVVITLAGRYLQPTTGNDDLSGRVGTLAPVGLRPGAGAAGAELIAPAHAPRLVDVVVGRSPADAAARGPVQWLYRWPFIPHAASPPVVAAAGGARVRIFAQMGALPPDRVAVEEGRSPSDGRGGRVQLRRGGGVNGGADRVNEASVTASPTPSPGFHVIEVPLPWEHHGSAGGGAAGAEQVMTALPQLEHRVGAAVFAVHPRAAAPGGGGTILNVHGRDFIVGETAVRLGEFTAAAPHAAGVVVSSVLIRVEAAGDHHYDTQAPAEVASSHDASDAAAWSLDGLLVAFHRIPAAHYSDPSWGTEEGGTSCKLTGREFRDGGAQLKCQFGSTVVTAAGFISMNHVDCVSPAHAPNPNLPTRLAVAVNGRDFSDEVERRGQLTFTYGARLEVFGLEPDHGPGTGGTHVTIHGANFIPTTMESRPQFSCRFGLKPVLASVTGGNKVTESSAVCRAPPHHVGFVSVEVSAGPGNYTTFGVMFEYQAAAAPDVLFPPTGLASGGTLVTVAGANFIASNNQHGYGHGEVAQPGSGGGILLGSASDAMQGQDALACRFGNSYTVGASAVSSAVLRCETPVFSDATIDRALAVDTSNNGGEDFHGAQTYFEPLADALVLSLDPRAGTKSGGTVVNVYGEGFTVDEPVWCRFGALGPIPAEFFKEGVVLCKSPAQGAGIVPLEISRGNTFDWSRNNIVFSV